MSLSTDSVAYIFMVPFKKDNEVILQQCPCRQIHLRPDGRQHYRVQLWLAMHSKQHLHDMTYYRLM